jgi:hypothetical protein
MKKLLLLTAIVSGAVQAEVSNNLFTCDYVTDLNAYIHARNTGDYRLAKSIESQDNCTKVPDGWEYSIKQDGPRYQVARFYLEKGYIDKEVTSQFPEPK